MLQQILKISHPTIKIQHSQNKYKKHNKTNSNSYLLLDIYVCVCVCVCILYITYLQCPYVQNNDTVTT